MAFSLKPLVLDLHGLLLKGGRLGRGFPSSRRDLSYGCVPSSQESLYFIFLRKSFLAYKYLHMMELE